MHPFDRNSRTQITGLPTREADIEQRVFLAAFALKPKDEQNALLANVLRDTGRRILADEAAVIHRPLILYTYHN